MAHEKQYPVTDFFRLQLMLADPATSLRLEEHEHDGIVRSFMVARRDRTTVLERTTMGGGYLNYTFCKIGQRPS